jgi:non-canonical purine NTP pyrophosphatase (RdgB/HAM1 family)
MQKLTFVTQNPNKVADAQKLLSGFEIEHVDFEVPEIQSLDPRKIVEYKLRFAYEQTGQPCFVMDASLFLDCLNGFPGPFVKWFYSETVGAEKTCRIAELFNQPGCQWTTVLGYFDGQEAHFLEETVKGTVADRPRGTNGYDWDAIFVPLEETRTFAQMSFEEKQEYAVTKKLLGRFAEFIRSRA